MGDDGLKLKYFVLSPGSSDPVHATASHAALMAYGMSLREQGMGKTAVEVEEWANAAFVEGLPRDIRG